MSEHSLGEIVRTHKKAEIGGAAIGAVVGLSFYFGRRALGRRREQLRRRGGLELQPLDPETYRERLRVFEDLRIDPEVRTTMAHAAAELFIQNQYTTEAVLTTDDFQRNSRVDMGLLSEALRNLQGLIGTRLNPRYMGGEGAETGYYAYALHYGGKNGVEAATAPSYAKAVEERLDELDNFGLPK